MVGRISIHGTLHLTNNYIYTLVFSAALSNGPNIESRLYRETIRRNVIAGAA